MESELLRNELLNIRNHLTTLSRNIDNTLLIYNSTARNRTRSATRRNLNTLFSELRNLYPQNQAYPNYPYDNINNTTTTQNNNIPPENNTTPNINEQVRNTYNNLFNNPEMIEVTLLNNGNRRVVNNMEDVQVFPSLRTLRESSTIHIYRDLDTDHESCSICRDNFEENSVIRRLGCEHIFHIGCIDTWFESNIRCPLCRHDIRENDTETENAG